MVACSFHNRAADYACSTLALADGKRCGCFAFSSGPENSAVILTGVLLFMASRMILYLFVPGYVAALLVGKLMREA